MKNIKKDNNLVVIAIIKLFRNNGSMFAKLKIFFYLIVICFIIYCVYLSSVFVLKGEVDLTNDIGRDFLLLQELDQKKIVLIGARSNIQDVFHGTFWTYLNYPAYIVGQGDPVVVAWFWIILGIIFLITTFLILRNLFNTSAALLAVVLLAVDLIPRTNNIFGQEATFYLMPFFLFTIYKYVQSKKSYFLALHLITAGLFIQLNIGVGGLFAVLSAVLSLGFIIRSKLWKHLLSFIFLPIVLLNFIIFDMRYGFKITKGLLMLGGSSKFSIPFLELIQNRIHHLISMQILANYGDILPFFLFLVIMFFTILEIKNKSKYKNLFIILLFYYFCYMILSCFSKGVMLTDYIYLLVPFSVIWLSGFVKGHYKRIFIPIILVIIYINFTYANNYLDSMIKSFIGKSPDSWIALKTVAVNIVDEQKGKEFGYYIYSPDSFAYQQRYAINYVFGKAKTRGFEYVKKPTTYVIAAPPPIDEPHMSQDWWIKNQAKISKLPIQTKSFSGGYIVEKFNLSLDEQKITHDPNIELGLHFR